MHTTWFFKGVKVTKLEDILDVAALDEMRRDGYIRQARHPELPYVSECYTKKTMFERAWTDETRVCRGLIWNTETGDVLARPFSKFFNWGEPSCPMIQPDERVNVWDKLDGSLGIIYDTPSGPAVATKNSFQSAQAEHATQVLRERYTAFVPPAGETVLLEIVYPGNRVVLDYKDVDDLFLIGVIDIESGRSLPIPGFGNPFTQPTLLGTGPFLEMADHFTATTRPNAEGVVIHAVNRDIRVKVKQADYLELHKVATGLNKKALWTMLSQGKGINEILSGIPEELHDWAFPILQDLCTKYTDLDFLIMESWIVIQLNNWHKDRKALAERMRDYPKWLSYAIWFLVDGFNDRYNEFLWKQVKP
jgi:RNA ligase